MCIMSVLKGFRAAFFVPGQTCNLFAKASSTVAQLCGFVATAFLAVSTAYGTELAGRVQDPQGFAVVGTRIVLKPAAGTEGHARTTAADSQGGFRFTEVGAGAYALQAVSPGFESYEQTIELGASAKDVEIELALAGVHDGVVVTASRSEMQAVGSAMPTSLLSDQRLTEKLPINLAQGLAEIPGVTWTGAGPFRSRPVIRGLDSNRILVMVDGERLNNNRTATNNAGIETSLVDVSDVQQVEVVRGPGSVMYGSDAFGGVVNIRTRSSLPRDEFGVGAKLGASAYPNSNGERGHAELSVGNRWFTARARGSAGNIDNYRTPDATVFGSSVDESSALGELRFFGPSDQTASFKFFHRGANNFGLPSLDPDPDFLATFAFSKLNKYSGSYQKNFRSAALSTFRGSFYTQNQHRDFSTTIQAGPASQILSETVTDVQSTGFDLQATSLPSPEHVLTYGVSYYRDRNRDFRVQQMTGRGPNPITLSAAPSVPNSNFSGTGVFIQDVFQVHDRVRLIAGVRADRFVLEAEATPNFDPAVSAAIAGNTTDTAMGGNFGASIDLATGWTVSGNVGRAFRAPNLFERFFFGRGSVGGFVVPNAGLDPETSLQFDAGLHYRSRPAKISLNYFVNELSDLISSAPGLFDGQPTLSGQPVFQNVNIQDARIQGVETTAEFALEGAGSVWTPVFTAAWQRGTNQVDGGPLPLIAPFIGHARLRWAPKKTRLWSEFHLMLVTGSDRVPEGLTPIRGFTTFGWRGGYELVRGEHGLGARLPRGVSSVRFYTGVQNLANRRYFGLFEVVPQPGRDFRAGLELTFDSSAK